MDRQPTIGAGLPQPAMQPLHPEKPPRPIVRGETWTKRSSQRNSNTRPTCRIMNHVGTKVGHIVAGEYHCQTVRCFRRDWE